MTMGALDFGIKENCYLSSLSRKKAGEWTKKAENKQEGDKKKRNKA